MARVDRTALANRIKARRREIGLTQREVAGDDFTRGFISQIENGLIDPSLKSLEIIAQRLGVPVSQFLETDGLVDPAFVEAQIHETYQHLDKDLGQAEICAKSAVEAAEQLDFPSLTARAHAAYGWVFYNTKDFTKALSEFTLSGDYHRRAGSPLLSARAYNAAGSAAHRAEQFEQAIKLYELALELAALPEEKSAADVLRIKVNLGLLHCLSVDARKGIKILDEVVILELQQCDYYRYGHVLNGLGRAHYRIDEPDKAIQHYIEAREFCYAVKELQSVAHITLHCGITYAYKRDYPNARKYLLEARDTYSNLKQPAAVANANAELARIAWSEGNITEAESLCSDALSGLEAGREKGRMHILQGRILDKQQNQHDALTAFTTGLELLDAQGESATADATEACFEIGNLLLKLGRAQEASQYLARAAASYRNMTQ